MSEVPELERSLNHPFLWGAIPSLAFGAVTDYFAVNDPYSNLANAMFVQYATFSFFFGPTLLAFLIKARIGPFVGFWSIWGGSVIVGVLLGGFAFSALLFTWSWY